MSKGIYALNIHCIPLPGPVQTHRQGVARNHVPCLFVASTYVRFWNEAPLGMCAPRNDLELIHCLRTYPDAGRVVADAALTAFARHLWYLAEHLVGLAFFDEAVDVNIKRKMVANMGRQKKPECPRRLEALPEIEDGLESFVTKRTLKLFDLLADHGKEKAMSSFLKEDPVTWSMDTTFSSMQEAAKQLKVVNDASERAIALIQNFNASLTKDEDQKQYLLRIVANHRRSLPDPSKGALAKQHQP